VMRHRDAPQDLDRHDQVVPFGRQGRERCVDPIGIILGYVCEETTPEGVRLDRDERSDAQVLQAREVCPWPPAKVHDRSHIGEYVRQLPNGDPIPRRVVRDRAVLRVGALAPAVPVTPRAAVPPWVVDAATGAGAAERSLQMPSQRDVDGAVVLLVGDARGAWGTIDAPQEIEQ
jgi:hypothetical protein